MNTRWNNQWEIFHAAIDLPDAERSAFLETACAGDEELRAELDALLAAHAADTLLPDPDAFLPFDAVDDDLAEATPGTQIGPYKIIREIGHGGMGAVFEAEQEQLDRKVALKLIRLGMDTRQVVARFQIERQALARMNHPNIAQVIDAGATDTGRPFFVMEYIDGAPITDYCDDRQLSTRQRLELFLDVCAGVQHAHQKGIIHRDIKPTNVLVAEEDGKPVPKIIDFGIAKATGQRMAERTMFTQAGLMIGTPEYMSPEQAGLSGFDVDVRTDVYSLGILLFELLVGALPFDPVELRRAGFDEILRRIREDQPSRPSTRLSTMAGEATEQALKRGSDVASLVRVLRGDLDWITMRAIEKDPARRYGTPSELAADLYRYANNEPVLAGPPTVSYRVGKFARRHRVFVGAASAVVLALVVGLGAATWGLLRAQEAEAIAREEARTAEEVSDFLTGLFRISEPSAVDVDSISARSVLDTGVARIRDELTDEPAVQSRLMQAMGEVYAQLGLLEDAEALFRDALNIRRNINASRPEIADSLAGLAGVRHLAGQHDESIEFYREAIAVAQADGRVDDPLWLATVYRSLGGVQNTLSLNDDALGTMLEAQSLLESYGLADDAEYGRVVRNIGITQWAKGEFEAARASYAQALDIFDATLGEGHPDSSYVSNSLAILNYNLGDYDAARPLLERELANLERTLGRNHRNTASIMNNLGLLLLDMGNPDEARPLIEESLAIREAVLDENHEEIATSLQNLARLQVIDGNFELARDGLARSLSIRENALGPNHPYVAGTLDAYADVLRELGETDEADALAERAAGIRASSN